MVIFIADALPLTRLHRKGNQPSSIIEVLFKNAEDTSLIDSFAAAKSVSE